MHFHQLRKELREIGEIVRTRCGQELVRRGFLQHRRSPCRQDRLRFEELLAMPVRDAPLIVLDTETTGFEPYGRDEILQVSFIEYRGLEPTGREFNSLVRPGVAIPPSSTAIHGIDDAMVADAPRLADIIDTIADFVDGSVLVGHHIAFDMRFLDRVCRRCLLGDLPNPRLDTAMLYLACGGSPERIGLDPVAADCGIGIEHRHNARGDALACGRILSHLGSRLAPAEMTVGELLERVHPIAGLSPHHPAEAAPGVTFRNRS